MEMDLQTLQDKASAAFRRARLCCLQLSASQLSRLMSIRLKKTHSVFELAWASSLADAIIGGYFVPHFELIEVNELIGRDNEGYLYFDGIRGVNVGDGITEVVVFTPEHHRLAQEFAELCTVTLLSGRTLTDLHEVAVNHSEMKVI